MLKMLHCKHLIAVALFLCSLHAAGGFEEEDWGDGLRVLTTYRPESCEHTTKKSDTIHYHYVGRLGENGNVFGKSFDYNSPYIVSLGHGRIIPGMDRGLVGMCLWERRRITFPPHLGYGERGVGQVIPPNATLVFYVRLIKIERNGHSLGEDPGINELWRSGLQSYNEQKWQQVVDMVEEALRLFHVQQEKSFSCIKDCRVEASDFKLNQKEREVVDKFSSSDPLVDQFLVYAARGKCIRECKANALTPKLRSPDPTVIKTFKQRVPYTYLHFSYYKVDNLAEGARCMFSYYFRHPTDEMSAGNAVFYREQLGLEEGEFVWREEAPGTLPHMDAYLAGQVAYGEEKWLQAVEHFEQALSLYSGALERCQLLCEDVMDVNLTQKDMSLQKKAKFDEYEFVPDTMEYYPLLVTIVKEVLVCRIGCHEEMASKHLEVVENYLSLHFHYLQFCYYKLGQIPKAAEAAATYQAMDPSNEQMTANIQYYTKSYKLQPDAFTPRQEFVDIFNKLESEKKLLHFAERGHVKKRDGQRGDSHARTAPPQKHNEL